MTPPMPFAEWLYRFLAANIEPFRPPAKPISPGRIAQLPSEDSLVHLKFTPPALPAGAVSFEMHYVPTGGSETVLPVGTDPVVFEVTTAGPLTFFTVAISATGVKSDPSPTDTFAVSDTAKPAAPTSAGTMEQVD